MSMFVESKGKNGVYFNHLVLCVQGAGLPRGGGLKRQQT